jgi:hypothetical protein
LAKIKAEKSTIVGRSAGMNRISYATDQIMESHGRGTVLKIECRDTIEMPGEEIETQVCSRPRVLEGRDLEVAKKIEVGRCSSGNVI